MTRPAVKADIPHLVAMGRRFHAASNQHCGYDEGAIAALLSGLIDNGFVQVTEGGVIGGVLNPSYCDPSWVMAVELFWWAEDRRGLRLLSDFENWAKESGAQEVRMTTLANLKSAETILGRRGYAPSEVSHTKVI